ncbi:MAG: endosialidase [Lachnospirales bacterium]
MAIVKEGIRVNEDNSLSFGNYEVKEKFKIKDFDLDGDIYYLKTHDEVTKLTKNDILLLESVPGSAVHNFKMNNKLISFTMEGKGSTSVTMELAPSSEYSIKLDDVRIGKAKTNMSGKLNFSVNLTNGENEIVIELA